MAEPTPAALRANLRKVLLMSGAWMFLLVMPVMVPFLQARGLGMAAVFQLQTIYALLQVVLEVPSGYVADVLGRKRCLLLASALYGLAFSWLPFSEGFWGLAMFEVVAAVAASLRSGTDVAILYDSLEALGEGEGGRVLGLKLFWGQSGETLAALIATALVAFGGGVERPAQVMAFSAWLPFLVVSTMVEPPRRKLSGTHRENARAIARALLLDSPLLRSILLTLVSYGLATLLVVWSVQDYWLALGLPLEWFGALWAAYNLLVALSGRLAYRLQERFGSARVLLVVAALPIAGYLGLAACAPPAGGGEVGWVVGALGVLAGTLFQVSRGLTQVVIRDELNRRVETSMRATANSLSSLGVRLVFAGLGPLLGWAIEHRGHGLAYLSCAGLWLASALLLAAPLAWSLRRTAASPE